MNVYLIAALLLADTELQEVERVLKRRNDWRTARKIGNVRSTLADALAKEQEGVGVMVAEFQKVSVIDQSTRQ